MPKRPKRSAKVSITTADQKVQLRRLIRQQLAGLSEAERTMEDDDLFSAFLALPEVEQANTLFLFWGTRTEPDTARLFAPLLEWGKRIVLPRMLPGRQMELRQYCPDRPPVKHSFGILEPDEGCPLVPTEEVDLVLVPALCYDRKGFRLGMGGGYYDRWLEQYNGLTVGLCRAALLQDSVPTEPHDRPVDMVITPASILRIK